MDPLTLTFAPDGIVRCLWTEAVPLHELGRLNIQRAYSIEYDNHAQTWRVLDRSGRCLYGSPSRQTCLEWEQEHLNRVLEKA